MQSKLIIKARNEEKNSLQKETHTERCQGGQNYQTKTLKQYYNYIPYIPEGRRKLKHFKLEMQKIFKKAPNELNRNKKFSVSD